MLERMDISNGEEDEDDDTEVALMTKMVKKWFKKKAGQGESSSSIKHDLKEYTCYNCQEKGHLAKTCTNPKVEATEKKALFSTWGEEDDEADLHEGFQGQCLMADAEALASEVKPLDTFPTRLNLLDKKDLINMIKGLLEDTEALESQVTEYEVEVTELRSECLDLSTRLANKEKALVKSRELSLMTKTCEGCNGKQPQGGSSKNLESKVESDLGIIIAKITELNESINKNTVNQTVFVRARTGIGYNSDVDSSKCSSANEKLTRELNEKAETLDKALQICRSKNEFLEKKVKALEQPSGDNHSWFQGGKAHKMYVSQAQGNAAKTLDPKLKDRKPFRPGKGKYGYVKYNEWCRFCGNNGHTIHTCKKKQALNNKAYGSPNRNPREVSDLNDPSYFKHVSSPKGQGLLRSPFPNTNQKANPPRKAELRWVPKV